MLEVLGFDQPYAMFEFSDSLENVIEVEVMKDILLTAYFNEVGEDVFVQLQNDLEVALQLDLDEYNIDLDLFFNTLVVDEDEAAFNELIDAVLIEDLQFDLDQTFIVPELIDLLNQFDEIDGTVDGIVGTTIVIADAEAYLLEKSSLSSILATLYLAVRSRTSAKFISLHQVELNSITVFSLSSILKTCFL